MENPNWNKIYEKVAKSAKEAQEKLDEGLLIDKNEAAVIREKNLYDVVEKERQEEARLEKIRLEKEQKEKEEREKIEREQKEQEERRKKEEEKDKKIPKRKDHFNAEEELEVIKKFSEKDGHDSESRKERRKTKKEKIEDYKENLALLSLDTAELNSELEMMVLGQETIDWNKIRQQMIGRTDEKKLSKKYVDNYGSLINDAEKRNAIIDGYYEKFQGREEEFYEALFGVSPLGKISVTKSPLAITILCEDSRDYQWTNHDGFDEDSIKSDIHERIHKKASTGQGAVIPECRIDELKYAIIVFDMEGIRQRPDADSILPRLQLHEEKHVMDGILMRPMDTKEMVKENFTKEEIEKNLRKDLLASFLILSADEIFAYLKIGEDLEKIHYRLFQSKTYDYFSTVKGELLRNKDLKLNETELDVILKEMEVNYKKYLESSFEAVKNMLDDGYPVSKVVGLFQTEDLRKWKKTYQRIKKQEEIRKQKKVDETEPEVDDENTERDPVRAASWHTINKLRESADLTYADLLDPGKTKITKDADGKIVKIETATTIEESDEKFIDLTRKLWDEIAVHGGMEYLPDTKEWKANKNTDLDAKSCLKMLELAGVKFDPEKVNYVNKGGTAERGVIMDTSGEHGVVSKGKGKRLILDHHGPLSDRSTSATKFVYETMVAMGLLKKEDYLDKYVDFVTSTDNAAYTDSEAKNIYANFSRNPYGLLNRFSVDQLLDFFKSGGDPARGFSDEYLQSNNYFNKSKNKEEPLTTFSEYMEKQVSLANLTMKKMEKLGFVVDTGSSRYGKVLVDISRRTKKGDLMPNISKEIGHLGVRANGYGGYISWSPQSNSFVIFTTRKMDEMMIPGGLGQGFNMRGNMWMKPKQDPEPLKVTLREVLDKLAGKKDVVTWSRLKEYLEKEKEGKKDDEAELDLAA